MEGSAAVHTHIAADRCPWCGGEISRAKFLQIEARIAEKERKKLAEERARMEIQLRAELAKTVAQEREEGTKKVAALSEKIKALEGREAAIRKEATTQAEAKLKTLEETKQKENSRRPWGWGGNRYLRGATRRVSV